MVITSQPLEVAGENMYTMYIIKIAINFGLNIYYIKLNSWLYYVNRSQILQWSVLTPDMDH